MNTKPIAPHVISMDLPLQIVSESNAREHWRVVAKRKKLHRTTARLLMQRHLRPMNYAGPVEITMTRIGPRKLDDDNLTGGFKATRDGIADWLGIDDGSDRLTWICQQRIGKHYGVEVVVAWGVEAEALA
jgi:hypothetical protein